MWRDIVCANRSQELAKEQIIRCEKRMKYTTDSEVLWDLYCDADDLWQENFSVQEAMDAKDRTPDHERIFLIRQKFLETMPTVIQINGDVTVNGKVYINGKK